MVPPRHLMPRQGSTAAEISFGFHRRRLNGDAVSSGDRERTGLRQRKRSLRQCRGRGLSGQSFGGMRRICNSSKGHVFSGVVADASVPEDVEPFGEGPSGGLQPDDGGVGPRLTGQAAVSRRSVGTVLQAKARRDLAGKFSKGENLRNAPPEGAGLRI